MGARVHVRSYWWEPESMLQEPESMLGVMGGAQSLCCRSQSLCQSCDYCVSPSPKNWVLGIFSLDQDLGTVGMGDSDLDSGLTIESYLKVKASYILINQKIFVSVMFGINLQKPLPGQANTCKLLSRSHVIVCK